jgi:hypothetical protein
VTPTRFAEFLSQLTRTAQADAAVIGLVGFGSTADLARADEGSDHDFAWLVAETADADRFRADLGWLPDAERIVASAIEHHGGVKVLYDDGHRLEFGIATVDDFAGWAGSPVRVLYGGDAVAAAAARVSAARPDGAPDPRRELALFLTQLLSGVGRARRGEIASASGLIRGEAVTHLLRVLIALHAPEDSRLDALDPRRRIEQVLPELAAQLEHACRLPCLDAAAALLTIAEREAAEFDPYGALDVARPRVAEAESTPTPR